MTIYFITGNAGKFKEAKLVIPELEQLDIDLPEIQSLDPRKIIEAKLQAAFTHHAGPFIVEDVSLRLDCLSGLPGPLIKWFLETIGNYGLADLATKYQNPKATSETDIGFARHRSDIKFFSSKLGGTIVPPRGSQGFGWDPIFVPQDHDLTFAEAPQIKAKLSTRRKAMEQLKQALLSA